MKAILALDKEATKEQLEQIEKIIILAKEAGIEVDLIGGRPNDRIE